MPQAQQFESFVKQHQNMVFSVAMRLLASESDARDIAQETFLRAWTRFGEIGGSPTAGGWLRTVASNLCLNHLTRYRSRWRLFSDMSAPGDEDPPGFEVVDDITPSDALDLGDHRELIERALRDLPEAQRVPLVLYHFENLGYEEIAACLRVSLGKVKTDIHRGRAALRRKLEPVLRRGDACVPSKTVLHEQPA